MAVADGMQIFVPLAHARHLSMPLVIWNGEVADGEGLSTGTPTQLLLASNSTSPRGFAL